MRMLPRCAAAYAYVQISLWENPLRLLRANAATPCVAAEAAAASAGVPELPAAAQWEKAKPSDSTPGGAAGGAAPRLAAAAAAQLEEAQPAECIAAHGTSLTYAERSDAVASLAARHHFCSFGRAPARNLANAISGDEVLTFFLPLSPRKQ